MKYCTTFAAPEADEVRFSINSMNAAMDYSKEHPDKKIIIEVRDLKAPKMPSINTMREIQDEYPFYYDFYNFLDFVTWGKEVSAHTEHIYDVFGEPINVYWRHMFYHFPATTWAMVKICQYYRASDIVIGEPLLFECRALQQLRTQGFTLRADPRTGINPYLGATGENSLSHFWLLPQHVAIYEKYIDVLELEATNSAEEKSLVDFYIHGKSFPYSLDLLIHNFKSQSTILGAQITDDFVRRRLDCGQRCLQPGTPCHSCFQAEHDAKIHNIVKKSRN